jgi:hypothetical protein
LFFDQLDERNAIVQSVLAFDKVGKIGLLADLRSRLSRFWLDQSPKNLFLLLDSKCDDSSMLLGRLDDRNMMVESVILFVPVVNNYT